MGEDGAQDLEIPCGDQGRALDDDALAILDDLGLAGVFEAHPEPRSHLLLSCLDWGDGYSGLYRQIAPIFVVGGVVRLRAPFN